MTPIERLRRRYEAKQLAHYLRNGKPATHSRKLDADKKPYAYIPGPHRTHQPHAVKQIVMDKATGALREVSVMHPGTLIKASI